MHDSALQNLQKFHLFPVIAERKGNLWQKILILTINEWKMWSRSAVGTLCTHVWVEEAWQPSRQASSDGLLPLKRKRKAFREHWILWQDFCKRTQGWESSCQKTMRKNAVHSLCSLICPTPDLLNISVHLSVNGFYFVIISFSFCKGG